MNKLTFFPKNTIGIFDSGVGGLSVLREIRNQVPDSPIIYFGDQFHVPYGQRELDEVYSLSRVITQFLLNLGAGIIVVACNTASAAALYPLREEFQGIPFVGMEPAVKPAAEKTHSGKVGVLATPATFQSKLYNSVVERFAKNVKIYQNTCSGLVQEIEKGNFSGIETRNILENALYPMLENEIDSIVLGCTHYPFVIPLIKEIVGPDVTVIDPAPAVAKQTMRILSKDIDSGANKNKNNTILLTSGSIKEFKNFINLIDINNYEIHQVKWSQDKSEINIVHEK
ncbi:MAG: glutamate racemase [Chloroflexi bacterium HGW-Chloroflexi-2]|jgi:glutamate racemase|nr:MAG: glutamate racemase [Chloroflexi bacterium HGW-Chloroflexi-2]